MAINHVKNLTVVDGTNTDIVRPGDWNSGHLLRYTITGNTTGASTVSGTDVQFGFGGNITAGVNGSTIEIQGPNNFTALSYQGRQLGASSHLTLGNSSAWLIPFRVVNPVSASTLMLIATYTGTITSAATAQWGQSISVAMYSQHSTDPNRFDTYWTQNLTMKAWNSGTSSVSYDYAGTTASSAGSNLLTASVMGMRMHTMTIGSVITPGVYLLGLYASTSSAGYSAAIRSANIVVDAPMNFGMQYGFGATASSIGYVDAGAWTNTTAGLPSTVSIGHIKQQSNQIPYFKIGAL